MFHFEPEQTKAEYGGEKERAKNDLMEDNYAGDRNDSHSQVSETKLMVLIVLIMSPILTGKGCRATVKPQAKKAFSRLRVTNLLNLANIFSENCGRTDFMHVLSFHRWDGV